jgi:hypothetical protein
LQDIGDEGDDSSTRFVPEGFKAERVVPEAADRPAAVGEDAEPLTFAGDDLRLSAREVDICEDLEEGIRAEEGPIGHGEIVPWTAETGSRLSGG